MKVCWIFLFCTFLSFELIAAETSTYDFNWLDPDKEVYVLQNRKYRKVGKVYLNVGGGLTLSGSFTDSKNVQVKAGHFFKEDFGLEVVYSKNSPDTNSTFKSVAEAGAVAFVPFVNSYYGGMFLWSPFYSKINTFDQIIYFDWIFGLGYAAIDEETNREDFNTRSDQGRRTSQDRSGVMWEIALRFYLSEHLSFRTDLTTIHYKGEKAAINSTEKVWYDSYDLTLALSYTF